MVCDTIMVHTKMQLLLDFSLHDKYQCKRKEMSAETAVPLSSYILLSIGTILLIAMVNCGICLSFKDMCTYPSENNGHLVP